MYRMDAIAFSKHIQCTREAKQDCLFTVRQLVKWPMPPGKKVC